jgi:hypothetical protein
LDSGSRALTYLDRNQIWGNKEAGALAEYVLPLITTAAEGVEFSFVVLNANGIRVTPDDDDRIYLGGSQTTATTGYIESTTRRSFLTIKCLDGKWTATTETGSWTVN